MAWDGAARAISRSGSARRHGTSLRWRSGRGSVEWSIWAGWEISPLEAPAEPGADGGDPPRAWSPAHLLPCGDGRGGAERVLSDASLSRPAAAGDDCAGLALHAYPADRRRRRNRLPPPGPGPRGVGGTGGSDRLPDVLSYGDMLDRMAHALGSVRARGSRSRCSRPGSPRCGSGWSPPSMREWHDH